MEAGDDSGKGCRGETNTAATWGVRACNPFKSTRRKRSGRSVPGFVPASLPFSSTFVDVTPSGFGSFVFLQLVNIM